MLQENSVRFCGNNTFGILQEHNRLKPTSFLDTVDTESHCSWQFTVMVTNQPVVFKIDTGAEVSVISESVFNTSLNDESLHQTTKKLCGPDQKLLEVLGEYFPTMTTPVANKSLWSDISNRTCLVYQQLKHFTYKKLLNSVSQSIPYLIKVWELFLRYMTPR